MHYLLTARFLDEVRERYHKCRFRSGVENLQESPLEFVVRKLKYIRALYPLPRIPTAEVELSEVQRVLEDIPKHWYQHLNIAQIHTTDELMRTMKFQELELTATEDVNLYKLAKQVAKINLDRAAPRAPYVRANLTSTKFAYPLDDFKSQRKPPRPCRHCGCEYHWDNDCPPRKADQKKTGFKPRAGPSSRGSSYQKAYQALQAGTEEEFSLAFTACINCSDDSSEAPEEIEDPVEDNMITVMPAYLQMKDEIDHERLPDDLPQARHLPIYDPPRARGRPPGCQPVGMDACHVECYINSVEGEKVEAVADSGTGATLIARELYERIKEQGVKMKQGIRMRLVQLTGDVKCQGYVTLNLYFRSQLGFVRLQNVEAYM